MNTTQKDKDIGWQKVNSECIYENTWIRFIKDEVIMPDGVNGVYAYIESKEKTVAIVARRPNNTFLLLEELEKYPYGGKGTHVGIVCGGAKEDQTREEGAMQELREEAGITNAKLTRLGVFRPSDGMLRKDAVVYLAEHFEEGVPEPEGAEKFFAQHWLTREQIEKKILAGEIVCGFAIMGFLWTFLYLDRKEKI